ncbi:MAG: DUF5615 family PIN-like protein [Deltaproteobacteria bacterium]|nr:DUF5615 family PIN-like protein [Deltaproteobacteria bacterium]
MPQSMWLTRKSRPSARDCGLRGKSDDAVYAFAQRHGAAIITGDLGFGNIIKFPVGSHRGIINEADAVFALIKQSYDFNK